MGHGLVFDVVIPSALRPSLAWLLASLGRCEEPLPRAVIVAADAHGHLPEIPAALADRVRLVRGARRGPAAARNAGWRAAAGAAWVAFLDDDVVVPPDWTRRLVADLARLDGAVAGSQGRVRVPLPEGRRPTDWERNVAGLANARWATADMAYRRSPLRLVGGFDESFPRAYREDADVALRLLGAGFRLVQGDREVVHPVGPSGFWASVRAQAGNADDAVMAARHGRGWRARAGAPPGRRPLHA
ncbi:MAG TPA: glycosyltransferase, partial [Actinomycetota bacterium]|nr:glycosyltransferase [Actinomycetota bacterium]